MRGDNRYAPIVRAGGLSELVADILLTCTGGVAGQVRSVQFGYYASTQVTSRLTSGDVSEALIIIDDNVTPATMVQSATNLLKTVPIWTIQFTDPGLNGTLTIRFTNIRMTTIGIVNSNPTSPAVLSGFITVNTGSGVSLQNPVQTVAVVQPGAIVRSRNCSGTGIPDVTPSGSMQYSLRFEEGFAAAFKPRVSASQNSAPPGTPSTSESGFIRDSPLLPSNVGTADTGTRLYARFQKLPAGARVFVASEPSFGSSGVTASLVTADATGAGGGVPVGPTTTMACTEAGGSRAAVELPVTANTATAVWEVSAASASTIDALVVGFRVEVAGQTT